MEKFIVFRPVHSWNCRRRRVWNDNKQSDPDKRGRDKGAGEHIEEPGNGTQHEFRGQIADGAVLRGRDQIGRD